ncbi:AfsR/SARP family transcriptional regulator [Herbidospora daliensis]|uniref:AfsR/SARP family transcriptional regulator n=1 Tax=Herbidospora daliensis TaxID=295585 RepID=UPI0007852848|nr:BTAD domain-containing putative transcriptional regulator [Herbidospora daliensis]
MRFAVLRRRTHVADESGGGISLSPIHRRLLTCLIVAGPRGSSPDALADAVWGPRERNGNSLSSAIYQLRRKLPGRVPVLADVYRIELADADEVDVHEFRALVAAAHDHQAAGRRAAAIEALKAALRRWDDEPLGDLPETPELDAVRVSLTEEFTTARAALFRLQARAGQWVELAGSLRPVLVDDPFAEDLHTLLMVSLYRNDQRRAALSHYEAAARMLHDETGSGPGRVMRAVRDAISADLPEADALQVAGLSPVVPPAAGAFPDAPPERARVPQQLPPAVVGFSGRARLVRDVARAVTRTHDGVPVVTLSGPAGVGKTALAVHVAHRIRDAFPDGQIWLAMSGMSEQPRKPADLLAELLRGLGVADADVPGAVAERTALMRTMLADRRVLVVIDDVTSDHHVTPLVPAGAGSAVMVTSRLLLSLPEAAPFRVEPVLEHESLEMLRGIVGADLVDADPGAAASIAAACGGLPFAVRVTTGVLATRPDLGLTGLAARLSGAEVLPHLRNGDAVVEGLLQSSYTFLPEDARAAYRMLGMAGPGPWLDWQAAMLLGVDDPAPVHETLARHNMIFPAGLDGAGRDRWAMHDLFREFAHARLADPGHAPEHESTMRRMLVAWLLLVTFADGFMPVEPFAPALQAITSFGPQPTGLKAAFALIEDDARAWFAASTASLLTAVKVACRQQQVLFACGLARRLSAWLYVNGRTGEAYTMWRMVLNAAEDTDVKIAAEARYRMARLLARQGEGRRALPMLATSIDHFAERQDRRALARALALRARLHTRAGRLDAGREDADRAVAVAAESQDPLPMINADVSSADVAAREGDLAEAVALSRRALSRARELPEGTRPSPGDERASYEVVATWALIRVLTEAGEADEAIALSLPAAELAEYAGLARVAATIHEHHGDLLASAGDRWTAVAAWWQAADLHGDRRRRAACLAKARAVEDAYRK